MPRVPQDWRTDRPYLLPRLAYISPLLHEPRGSTAVGVLPPQPHTALSVQHTSTLRWHGTVGQAGRQAGRAFSKCPIQIVMSCSSRYLLSESKIYRFSLFLIKKGRHFFHFRGRAAQQSPHRGIRRYPGQVFNPRTPKYQR